MDKHTPAAERSARQIALENARGKGAAVTAQDIAKALGLTPVTKGPLK